MNGSLDSKSALVQALTLSPDPMLIQTDEPYGVIRPQWGNLDKNTEIVLMD